MQATSSRSPGVVFSPGTKMKIYEIISTYKKDKKLRKFERKSAAVIELIKAGLSIIENQEHENRSRNREDMGR